jgi:hypothetical protein
LADKLTNDEELGHSEIQGKKVVKYAVKDSVFTDLFKIKKYLLRLYKDLHPEDCETTEHELGNVTIKNIMTDKIYNDLGFVVGDRIIVFVEAQSTWSVNIIIRVLLYLAQTYLEYFERTKQNLYKAVKVNMPKPEIYVVYTGERGNKPSTISLSKDFFDGEKIGLDIEAKVIYESDDDSIINEYIKFTKVYDEQRTLYGRSRKAIMETIRICKDRNLLREYFESRESEVVTIMMSLFDEEEIMRSYIESERYDAEKKKTIEMARDMITAGELSLESIAKYTKLPLEDVKKIQSEMLQLA